MKKFSKIKALHTLGFLVKKVDNGKLEKSNLILFQSLIKLLFLVTAPIKFVLSYFDQDGSSKIYIGRSA